MKSMTCNQWRGTNEEHRHRSLSTTTEGCAELRGKASCKLGIFLYICGQIGHWGKQIFWGNAPLIISSKTSNMHHQILEVVYLENTYRKFHQYGAIKFLTSCLWCCWQIGNQVSWHHCICCIWELQYSKPKYLFPQHHGIQAQTHVARIPSTPGTVWFFQLQCLESIQ